MSFAALKWAWERVGLPPSLKLVLLALAEHHNAETGRCDPGACRIATLTGLSERTVRSSLGMLASMGFIGIQRRDGRRSNFQLSTTMTSEAIAGVQVSQGCSSRRGPLKPLQGTPETVAGLNQEETGKEPFAADPVIDNAASVEDTDPDAVLFRHGVADLIDLSGIPNAHARSLIAKLRKTAGGDARRVLAAIKQAKEARPADLVPWLFAALRNNLRAEAPQTEAIPKEVNGFIVAAVIDRTLDDLGVGDLRFPDLPRAIVALLREGFEPDAIYGAAIAIGRRGVETMRSPAYLASIVRGRQRERGPA
ncbi:helix-turn-helix domain-containing protein [Neoroseomonas lacus]|uniref:Helix-turn-helix domain-containing protein n=1 Tax=Neoroseomonas lacus TaxID=287609 RepID=A0A917KQ06_9PROT|nr:helix-turn-helix domain-containing protein [Neoroseomonas lacus]GGJ22648.1 hypothetical protein GCM10011320_32340 [Neoroseomonas lacus]